MTYSSKGYRPGRLPRYQQRRFNPLPYLAAVGAILLSVIAIVVLMVAQPWVSNATPTPTLTPIPSIPTLPSLTPSPEATPSPDTTDQLTPEPGASMIVYVVKSGDNFSKIAAKFHLTRAELLAANPQIKNPNNIYVGQKIFIPVPAPATQPSDAPTATPTDTPEV